MLRQTDPNWIAYFFVTDQVPFENRLRKILSSYGDRRLQYISIDYAHRPVVRTLKCILCFILSLFCPDFIPYAVVYTGGCRLYFH